ncbi:L,D-transpeptidase [Rubritalea marina]|uniref:L,D-transpeptidase n=1 Tax=Rubritalea marina TaxID=361055 RepID=UPI000363944D|nr:L,D-transpeptidase [Rubritalea marina]
MKNILLALSSAALAIFLSSCEPNANLGAYDAYNRPATKPQNPNNVRVKVSTNNQMVYVMEGNKPLLVMPVSVGKASTPTPKGNFTIYSKEEYRRANTHGYFKHSNGSYSRGYLRNKPAGTKFIGTPMPYWMEFKSAYGFHTGWMKHTPCTHGCIRMHHNVAPKFFKIVKTGTPVNIAYSQPEDQTIGRNVPRPVDAGPLPDFPIEYLVTNKVYKRHKPPTLK